MNLVQEYMRIPGSLCEIFCKFETRSNWKFQNISKELLKTKFTKETGWWDERETHKQGHGNT